MHHSTGTAFVSFQLKYMGFTYDLKNRLYFIDSTCCSDESGEMQ